MGDGLGRDGAMLYLGGGGRGRVTLLPLGGGAGGGRLRLAALAHQPQLCQVVQGLDPTDRSPAPSQPTIPLFGDGLLGSSALLDCVRDVEDGDEEDSFKENRPTMFTFDSVPLKSYPLMARDIDV